MAGKHGRSLNRLGRWSPALYLFGGVLLVGYAVLNGIAATTDEAFVMIEDVVGPAGFLLGFIGALGVYAGFADRSATVARVGAVCMLTGITGFFVITLNGIAVLTGVTAAKVPLALLLLVAIGMIPGYASVAVASLRDETQATTVGILLFVPAVVFAAMLTQPFVYSQLGLFSETTMAWSNFGISSSQAFAHLAIGYTLRSGLPQTIHASPSPDGTIG